MFSLISAQLNTEFKEPDYDELKKVYSIWICFESTSEQANAISEYKITKHDILKGIRDNKEALSSQYGFAISDDFGKELNLMCNLSEALIEKGIKPGRSEGENRLQQLLNCLSKAGRHVELEEILAGNEQLKQQLYKEFNL